MGLFKRTKNTNKPVLRQILDLIPDWILQRNITKFNSDKGCHKYKTYDHLFTNLRQRHRTRYKRSNTTKKRGIIKDHISIRERPGIIEQRTIR